MSRPQAVRESTKSQRVGLCNGEETEEELHKILKEIKGELSIDYAIRIYNNMIKALFDSIFPKNEKGLLFDTM